MKKALGLQRCWRIASAAAPMSKEILDYFLSLDIRIMEIYGMSECSGPHLMNVPDEHRMGSVGRLKPGLHSKLFKAEAEADNPAIVGKVCNLPK